MLNLNFCIADSIVKKEISKNEVGNIIDKNNIVDSNSYYKLLYENAKDNNDQMITILEWVVGLSTSFLLALFLAQIFFNWRLNKKEIDYIKKDIDEKIGELKASLLKEINDNLKISELKIEKTIKVATENLEKQIAEKSKIIELTEKLWQKDIESLKVEFTNKNKFLELDISKNSGDIWKLQGVESNALTLYLKTAFLKKEVDADLQHILDDIISVLKDRDEIHQIDYMRLEELAEGLDKKYDTKKALLISLFKDKPTYVYSESPEIGFGKLGSNYGRIKKYVKNEPKK